MNARLWAVLTLAQWRDQPLRTLVTLLAIAVGVALASAVWFVNSGALAEFGQATRRLVGEADVIVRGPSRTGFPEQLYATLATTPGVEVASPVLELDVALAGRRGSLRLLGVDPFRAGLIQPMLFAELSGDFFGLFERDGVFLSGAAAADLGVAKGDRFEVLVGTQRRSLRVLGLLSPDAYPQRLGIMDIASAQWTLDRLGVLNRIDLRTTPGTPPAAFRQRLATLLPPGLQAIAPEVERDRAVSVTRAYRVNLNMLALVSLLTGAFLVFSTQSLSVLRRRSGLALLRALGVTRGQLQRALFGEGLALGAVGFAARRGRRPPGRVLAAATPRRRPRRRPARRHRRGARAAAARRTGVPRDRHRRRQRWRLGAGARGRAARSGERAEGRRRRARARAAARRAPWPRTARARQRPRVPAGDRRHPGVRLPGRGRAAVRRRAAGAADHRRAAGARTAHRPHRARRRPRAAARRRWPGHRRSRGGHRQLQPDGRDGHHGVLVPRVVRTLARRRAARRRAAARRAGHRHRLPRARRAARARGAAGPRARRVPATDAAAARSRAAGDHGDRARFRAGRRTRGAAAGADRPADRRRRRAAVRLRRRTATDLDVRGDRGLVPLAARRHRRAAIRRPPPRVPCRRRVP